MNNLKIALCGLEKSEYILKLRLSDFLGSTSTNYKIHNFNSLEKLFNNKEFFDVYFINSDFKIHEKELLAFIRSEKNKENHDDKYIFLTYSNVDPLTEEHLVKITEFIKRHLHYDKMYLTIEFLTNKGLKNIRLDKIIYFEFLDRKVTIKTETEVFSCKDSLYNILHLVENQGFSQPHKSFIINFREISKIKNYQLTMSNGDIIPLSQKRSRKFRINYKKFLQNEKT